MKDESWIKEIRDKLTPDRIGYLGMMMPRRIGFQSFFTFLEYRHFKPGTKENDEFNLGVIKWKGIQWVIVVIPMAKKQLAEDIMKELGLKAADGVPVMFDHEGQHIMPLDLPNVFTIENVPGHFAYNNDPKLEKTAEEFEEEACEKIINDHYTDMIVRSQP